MTEAQNLHAEVPILSGTHFPGVYVHAGKEPWLVVASIPQHLANITVALTYLAGELKHEWLGFVPWNLHKSYTVP